ncbi:hypothetical protein DFH09DRAFT_1368014 [Mycena vulgaris]|nr:hypothetical protein DFH09DRAFT_1368014 [Mycena vulgaris]
MYFQSYKKPLSIPRAYVDSLHRPHHGDYFWMFCHPKSWKPRAPGRMTGRVRFEGVAFRLVAR